jgi:hypothetical protein
MKRAPAEPNSPEIERLLAAERDVPTAPPALKARALEQARVAFLARRAAPAPSLLRSGRPWAVAIAAAMAVATLSFAALRALAPSAPVPAPSSTHQSSASPPTPTANTAGTKPETLDAPKQIQNDPPPSGSSNSGSAAPRRASAPDAHAVELAILQRARAAVASARFSAALESIAEHQRRFPNGLLQEEREALRVKALAGLGETDAARSAARRFREKFPNSVLSPRLETGTPKAP